MTAITVIFVLGRNESLYVRDRNQVEADVKAMLKQLQPPGKQVYYEVKDLGCDSSNSVGLATYIHCEVEGYKYFSTRDNPAGAAQQLDTFFTKQGWKKNYFSNHDSSERDQQVLNATQTNSIAYMKNVWAVATVDLMLAKDHKSTWSYISPLLEKRKIPTPAPDESLFGVHMTVTYWSCRESSVFKLPCPSSPSPADIR